MSIVDHVVVITFDVNVSGFVGAHRPDDGHKFCSVAGLQQIREGQPFIPRMRNPNVNSVARSGYVHAALVGTRPVRVYDYPLPVEEAHEGH